METTEERPDSVHKAVIKKIYPVSIFEIMFFIAVGWFMGGFLGLKYTYILIALLAMIYIGEYFMEIIERNGGIQRK